MTRASSGAGGPRIAPSGASAFRTALDLPVLPDEAPDILKKHTIFVRDPERILVLHNTTRQRELQTLIRRYVHLSHHMPKLTREKLYIATKTWLRQSCM